MLLIERVKNSTKLPIGCGNFQNFPAPTVADINIVAEINCSRFVWRDALSLKARFGKHEHLRFDGHRERCQEIAQVPMLPIERQPQLAAF